MAAIATATAAIAESSSSRDHLPRLGVAISWDSEALRGYAEKCEAESEAFMDPVLLPTLEGLLQEVYTSLRPEPVDYEFRQVMISVFNRIAEEIFGKRNGLPIVEPFGSFTMDLFTAQSDLDLSVNFNTDVKSEFPRKEKISAIRRLAKVLLDHQRNGRCYGVLPIVHAIVPVLKVTDQGTGVECDISIENKDGMSRSMIFKFISSIDERFRILCYLMKFWAKSRGINSPKDRTISSMAIISLVAFHLQTRNPPILPAFSAILKDGSDLSSIETNILLYRGFGSRNKESIAELFVSLMSKLVSVEGLWEQGLCASNFEGSWISKTWDRGIGNLSVEDLMDRSQNFARSVGKEEMQTICECLRATVSNLSSFFMGKIDAPRLKALLFGPLKQDEPVINVIQRNAKRKRVNPDKKSNKKNAKRKKLVQDKPVTPVQTGAQKKKLDQDKRITPLIQKDAMKKKLDQDRTATPVQTDAKKNKLDQGKPITLLVEKDAMMKKLGQDEPATLVQTDAKKKLDQDKRITSLKLDQDKSVTPVQKYSSKKKLGLDKAVTPTTTIRKDAKSSTSRPDSGGSHVQQNKNHASTSHPASVFIPLQAHLPGPTQRSSQFLHIPQPPINLPLLAHGLPEPQLHPAYRPYRELVGHPPGLGNFIHPNNGIQLQHQGPVMFAPLASHHPVMYGINGAQQMQHYDNRFVQRPPYGIGPSFWR